MINSSIPLYGSDPAYHAVEVTPNDDADVWPGNLTRGIRIGYNGDIEVVMASGATVVIGNCMAGEILPIRVSRIKAGFTTAEGITAFF